MFMYAHVVCAITEYETAMYGQRNASMHTVVVTRADGSIFPIDMHLEYKIYVNRRNLICNGYAGARGL